MHDTQTTLERLKSVSAHSSTTPFISTYDENNYETISDHTSNKNSNPDDDSFEILRDIDKLDEKEENRNCFDKAENLKANNTHQLQNRKKSLASEVAWYKFQRMN